MYGGSMFGINFYFWGVKRVECGAFLAYLVLLIYYPSSRLLVLPSRHGPYELLPEM